MTVNEVIKFFGTLYKAAKITGYSVPNTYNWKKRGKIPIKAQIKIEKITTGELKASISDSQ